MANNYKEQQQDLKIQQEDWMVKKWRPMMGWTYMATCIFDFILGPILYNMLQYWNPGQAVGMWTPLTLQGGGMYHIAMGAILGISAWSRGQEKMNGSTDPKPQAPVFINDPGQYQQPAPVAQPIGTFNTEPAAQPASTGWDSAPVANITPDNSGKPTRKANPF